MPECVRNQARYLFDSILAVGVVAHGAGRLDIRDRLDALGTDLARRAGLMTAEDMAILDRKAREIAQRRTASSP
jgi:hypothetical protein